MFLNQKVAPFQKWTFWIRSSPSEKGSLFWVKKDPPFIPKNEHFGGKKHPFLTPFWPHLGPILGKEPKISKFEVLSKWTKNGAILGKLIFSSDRIGKKTSKKLVFLTKL